MDCARSRCRAALAAALVLVLGAAAPAARADEGAELYAARCANCHDHPQPGLPPKLQLASHPVAFIVEKLTFGSMAPNALGLTDEQIALIARHLSEAGPSPP